MAVARVQATTSRRWLSGLGMAAVLWLLVGCVTGTYQSEDYVIYRLEQETTPEALAARFLKDPRRSWVIEEANPADVFQPGKTVIIPRRDDNRAGLFREGFQVVPILCYHRFGAACGAALCVSEASFRAHLQHLKDNGYRTISLGDLHEFMSYRRAIPLRSVVITIDDGYRSSYDIAFPLLEEFGFTATLFVYTDFVGSTPMSVSWDQLREMRAAGFEIGSHSVTHSDLTRKQADETDAGYQTRIMRELSESKAVIDRELGQDTRFLAYPYSQYNRWVLAQAEAAGYRLGLTLEPGANPFFADPRVLRRNPVLQEDLIYFGRRISTLTPVALD